MGAKTSKPKLYQSNHIDLTTVNPQLIENVIFKNQVISVYIYEVYDGDTVKFLAFVGNKVIKLSLRLLGIDTPEIRSGAGRLVEEKTAGIMARNRLSELINSAGNKHLTNIIIRDWDKFGGRVLGDIILENGCSVAEILINEGYAKPYHGEKKELWTMEDLSLAPFCLKKKID